MVVIPSIENVTSEGLDHFQQQCNKSPSLLEKSFICIGSIYIGTASQGHLMGPLNPLKLSPLIENNYKIRKKF